jgi:hypothetical protein
VIKKIGNDKYDSQLIDLKEVKSCHKKVYKSVIVGDSKRSRTENRIEKIVLEFEYLDARTPAQITFFEPLNNHMLTMFEIDEKAKKWERIISKLLSGELKEQLAR